jgi:hypothetical protein
MCVGCGGWGGVGGGVVGVVGGVGGLVVVGGGESRELADLYTSIMKSLNSRTIWDFLVFNLFP